MENQYQAKVHRDLFLGLFLGWPVSEVRRVVFYSRKQEVRRPLRLLTHLLVRQQPKRLTPQENPAGATAST